MNIKYHRINLNESEFAPVNGERKNTRCFSDAKRYNSVGNSIIFTATANMDIGKIIKKGDLVYFKANNSRGVNNLGRTEESFGSCEDVAEVFSYNLLKNLSENLGEDCVLTGTPYGFSEYSNDDFWKMIAKETNGLVESSRLYGCVSPNIIDKNGIIVHGDSLLNLLYPTKEVYSSAKNTIYSYSLAAEEFTKKSQEFNQETVVSPNISRFLANTMFFDYFIANSDRHCKNVNLQQIKIYDGTYVLAPLPVLDNGGAFCLQGINCDSLYKEASLKLNNNGKFEKSDGAKNYNSFDCQYDFSAGSEIFKNQKIANLYPSMSYEEQLVMLISQNKTLYNDFKKMYSGLDFKKSYETMVQDSKYPRDYLPEFDKVTSAVFELKKREVSKVMAKILGKEFSEEEFDKNQDLYIDEFEKIVQEDELTIHISNSKEEKEFEQMIKLASQLGE